MQKEIEHACGVLDRSFLLSVGKHYFDILLILIGVLSDLIPCQLLALTAKGPYRHSRSLEKLSFLASALTPNSPASMRDCAAVFDDNFDDNPGDLS
jgi:hypothetical protein